MKKINCSIFTSWPLIISLILLLLNDLYFKPYFSNWLTGKVSDFSGIFLVAIILFRYSPNKKYIDFICIILMFSFWKSPYSEPAIHYFNSLGIIQYSRVIDYSDLMALILLPLSLHIAKHSERYQIHYSLIKIIKIPVIILAVYSISATSVSIPHHKYEIRKNSPDEKINITLALKIVKEIANNYKLKCERCKLNNHTGIYQGELITLKYTIISQQRGIMFDVIGIPSSLFSSNNSYEKINNIKQDLQYKLGTEFKNMEFVINLPIPNE